MNFKNNKIKYSVLLIIFILTMFGALTYLHHKQALVYLVPLSKLNNKIPFLSDLHLHLRIALTNSKSMYSIIYLILKELFRTPFKFYLIAVFFSLIEISCIYITYAIFKTKVKIPNNNLICVILTIVVTFVLPIYLPFINKYHFLGLISPNMYHNITYSAMKLFGLVCLQYFFRIEKEYQKGLSMKEYLVFSVLLVLTASAKPNFIIVFASVALTLLIIDLVKSKGKILKNSFKIALTIIPVLLVLIYQSKVMFDPAIPDDSGMVIDLFYSLALYNNDWIIGLLQSYAFPIIVLILFFKEFTKDKEYRYLWFFNVFALIVFSTVSESGSRKDHINMVWGNDFFIFTLFMASLSLLATQFHKERVTQTNNRYLTKYIVCLLILILHLVSGILYFFNLLNGAIMH